ncbi:MAG: PQQ-like beta-propeller repeat protein [Planctomycetaceae bacterium]|nr:PQQ-like beta-propeller repeat protein [Planctomycetaceae bacterium]
MNHLLRVALAVTFCLNWGTRAHSADWPQYRGPNRDDVSTETGLLSAWPEGGPKLLWTFRDAGIGYSGVAIVGDRLYTLGDRGEQEFLIAVDVKNATDGSVKAVWSVEIGAKFDFKGNQWSAGPSATPTVDGDRIYALSGNGDLVCVNTAGKEVWRKHLPTDLQAQVNPIGGGPKNLGWGFTWSPLVDGERLICTVGGPLGTVAALNKQTGEVVWRSTELTEQAAYTSPILAEFDGVRQYIVLTNQGLRGIAAADGKLLWKHDHRLGTEVVSSPIIHGSLVHITVGTANGNDIVEVKRDGDKFVVEELYSGNNLSNHHGNVVRVGDYVYGSGARQGFGCQKLPSGELAWTERKIPTGSMTYADGKLFCYGEGDGTLHLLEANPTACNILGKAKIPTASTNRKPSGKIWTPPVVSGGRLFVRDQELIFCYDVKQ